MTDRQRLIDLMIEAKRTDPETGSFTEYLADYLISNGVVVLPCKVGDIVYVCYEEIPIIHKKQICLIICQHSYGKPQLEFHCTDFYIFYGEEIGKTVFLTRKEAEKALNDMKQGDKI